MRATTCGISAPADSSNKGIAYPGLCGVPGNWYPYRDFMIEDFMIEANCRSTEALQETAFEEAGLVRGSDLRRFQILVGRVSTDALKILTPKGANH
jgi:hypothetical protein